MYQLRKKKILPILLPSMVEAKNFSDHSCMVTEMKLFRQMKTYM